MLNPAHEYLAKITGFLFTDAQNGGGYAQKYWDPLLAAAYPELEPLPLNHKLLVWCLRVEKVRHLNVSSKLLDLTEHWAGSAGISLQHLIAGFHVACFDRVYEDTTITHDCQKPEGLRLWLDSLTGTNQGSINWFGTQCSQYLGMCFYHHKRSVENQYFGDTSIQWVVSSNQAQAIAALMIFLSWLIANEPLLEQPAESCLPKMVPMRTVLHYVNAIRTSVSLRNFGARSLKPLQIWHVNPAYSELRSKRGQVIQHCQGKPLARVSISKRNGKKTYTGNKMLMKTSQVYPVPFNVKVASISSALVFYSDASHGASDTWRETCI